MLLLLCPITINTWNQLTNEKKVLFKEVELDKNPAVTLNVCEVHVPSDESGDDKMILSIDNPACLIKLLKEVENTGKERLTVTISVQSDDSTCDDSDDSTGCSWDDIILLRLPINFSLNSLTLTINNFSLKSTVLSFRVTGCLESCISLKSLNLTLNEYNKWKYTYASHLHKGLGRKTSLISLTLTLSIYTRPHNDSYFDFDDVSDDDVFPNISMDSFTLTINDFNSTIDHWESFDIIKYVWGFKSGVLWPNYKSLNTFNITLNSRNVVTYDTVPEFFDAVMKVNSLRTLRLNFNVSAWSAYDFSKLQVKSPSLELIELTISPLWTQRLVIELPRLAGNFEVGKTLTTDKLQVHTVTHKVDLKSKSSCKNIFCRNNSQICCRTHVGAAKLGNICFCSKVYSTTFSSLARPGLNGGLENVTKKLSARAFFFSLSEAIILLLCDFALTVAVL